VVIERKEGWKILLAASVAVKENKNPGTRGFREYFKQPSRELVGS
jgi:hypothetical protein